MEQKSSLNSTDSKIRILVVEDEYFNARQLKKSLESLNYFVVDCVRNPSEAEVLLNTSLVDLVLLDINLKSDKDGIWLGKQIREKYNLPFIFISAYATNSVVAKAIDVRPSAYLTKPYKDVELFAAIEVAMKEYNANRSNSEPNPFFFAKHENRNVRVNASEIDLIEAKNNYVILSVGDSELILRSSIKEMANKLPSTSFIQTHRSYLVNKKKIKSLMGDKLLVMNHVVPISRSYRAEVLKQL